ncbi:hypothetical protein EUGRSUZ_G01052 [Eucalyptus grandis]|uniref:NAC domain-containing protein n=2 Tax=Eucalyptus grandis TaxID=71139 RepID=A0A059BC20_EUCGR|nr:hypothetical protein EUGRSUZ_G01052 [Eucalyptus grandis]
METRIHPMNFEVKEIALLLQQKVAGYGFRPTEEELINYLKSAVPGWRESFCIIPTLENVYRIDPWDLPAKFNENSIVPSSDQEWWFICPQAQNQRNSRKTPCGFSWNITGKPRDITAKNDVDKIGYKRMLVFQDGVPTNWVIHEYHLPDHHFNSNYVLCHLKRRRNEEADNLAYLESYLHQPDHEDSFAEYLIQETMNSLIENESPPVMDFTLDNGLYDEYIQLASETSEEDEDVDYMLNRDFVDVGFFDGDAMETQSLQHGQGSNLHNESPALMRNRRTRTIDSLHGVVPLEEKKGMVENKFNGSLIAPEKPTAPPVHAASAKYRGKDEVPQFEKAKQETGAKRIKPEYTYWDEREARAKNGQISIMENRQTRTNGSVYGAVPLEQKKGVIQSKFNRSHVSSAKPTELPEKPKTPKISEPSRFYINEGMRREGVKKQEIALSNIKTECVSWDEAVATAKVLKYREHCSSSNSPRKKTSRETEQAREKANSVTARTRPTTTNPPQPNPLNVIVGIILLFALIYDFVIA